MLRLNAVEHEVDLCLGIGRVDLREGVNCVAIGRLRNPPVRVVSFEGGVALLFLGTGKVAGRELDRPDYRSLDAFRDPELMAQSLGRPDAVSQLDDWEIRKVDAEQINEGRARRTPGTASCTGTIAPNHITDGNILAVPADVPITAISRLPVLRTSGKVPAKTTGLLAISSFTAGIAPKSVPAIRSLFDAVILPTDYVTAGQDKMSMALAIRIVPNERHAQARCSGKATITDTVGAIRFMIHDHARALALVQAASAAPDQEVGAVNYMRDNVKAFCRRGLAQFVIDDFDIDREPFVAEPDVEAGVGGVKLVEYQNP